MSLAEEELFSGENAIDLLIEDQLLQHSYLPNIPTREPSFMEGSLIIQSILQSIDHMAGLVARSTPPGDVPTTATVATSDPLSSTLITSSVEPTSISTSSVLPTASDHSSTTVKTTGVHVSSVTELENEQTTQPMQAVSQAATETSSTTATQNVASMRFPTVRVTTTNFQVQTTAEATSAVTTKTVISPDPARPSLTATPKEGLDEEDIRNSIGELPSFLFIALICNMWGNL